MRISKIFITTLSVIILCLFIGIALTGCSNNMIDVVGTIIAKYDRQEYNTAKSWWWEQPIYETKYYFVVQYNTNTYEITIDSKTYYTYEIGDKYTIKVKSEAL